MLCPPPPTSSSSLLPRELWLSIMFRLSSADLLTIYTTCKVFNCLAYDVLRNVKLSIHRPKAYKLGLVSLVSQAWFVRVGLDLSEKCGVMDRCPGLFSRDSCPHCKPGDGLATTLPSRQAVHHHRAVQLHLLAVPQPGRGGPEHGGQRNLGAWFSEVEGS